MSHWNEQLQPSGFHQQPEQRLFLLDKNVMLRSHTPMKSFRSQSEDRVVGRCGFFSPDTSSSSSAWPVSVAFGLSSSLQKLYQTAYQSSVLIPPSLMSETPRYWRTGELLASKSPTTLKELSSRAQAGVGASPTICPWLQGRCFTT